MADEKKQGLVVFVPKRQDFAGYYSAGEFWPSGPNPVEVVADKAAKDAATAQARKEGTAKRFITEAQAAEMKAEQGGLLSLLTAADAAKVTGFDPSAVAQDEDERKMLEDFRKQRGAKSNPQGQLLGNKK